MSKFDIELFAPTAELRRLIHDYSKDDREFARYIDSLKTSVLSAFYTPAPVVDAIAGSVKDKGIKIERFLEPSAGQGAFVDSFLHFYTGADTLDFEKYLIKGKVLSILHQSITTKLKGLKRFYNL